MPSKPRLGNLGLLSVILVTASAGCAGMVFARWILTGRLTHFFLIWNLILAWVPYLIALVISLYRRLPKPGAKRVFVSLLTLFWLIFYPNSPYIFTDLIHVVNRSFGYTGRSEWVSANTLLWFDLIVNSTFAFVGHFIGLVSMAIVQGSLKQTWNRLVSRLTIGAAILLSGTGIYIGRFVRLNSWDIFVSPLKTMGLIGQSILSPRAMFFSLCFSFFIASSYLCLYMFRALDIEGP